MAADDSPGAIAGDARRRLDAIRRALAAEMAGRLMRLSQSGGVLTSEKDALANARKVRADLVAVMRESGLPVIVEVAERAVLEAVDAALGPAAVPTRQPAGALGFSFEAQAKASILRSVSGVLDEVADQFAGAVLEMRRAVDVGVNTGSTLEFVTSEVALALDTSFARASVAVETAVRGAHRLAIQQQVERAAEATGEAFVYLYDGPDDSKTRPFCDRHVGKAYTPKAMRRLSNGTELDAATFGGGHGCRHRWVPLLREDAEAEGYAVSG